MKYTTNTSLRDRVIQIVGLILILISGVWSQAPIKVFVFQGFFGYEHSAIVTATAVIKNQLPTLLSTTPAFTVDASAEAAALTPAALANYQVLVLNNNTGLGGLTTAQRSAVLAFGQTKGIVGIHSTADFKGSGGSWPEMIDFVGGNLSGHTAAMGTLKKDPSMASHPINAGLADVYSMNDEWYGYGSNPRNSPGAKVLWTIDETSMNWTGGGDMPGNDHPISWIKEMPGGGRFFFTAQGHRDSIMEKNFHARRMLYNAILWVAKSSPTTIAVSPDESTSQNISLASEHAALRISFMEGGRHDFGIFNLTGHRVFFQRGEGAKTYAIPALIAGTVYIVKGQSRTGSFSKFISVP
jgi:cytochrome c